MEPTILKKIMRQKIGAPLRVLDLFAGCGGISLGFKRAGFDIVGAVEKDPEAAKTHALNFHDGDEFHGKSRDITETEPEQLIDEIMPGQKVDECIDVIVGGPPCQAFARIGRAKLRNLKDDDEAWLNDERVLLYKRYLHYVDVLKPLAILIENVPDMLNHGGNNVGDQICMILEEHGYHSRYSILNAVFYGVPQMRPRMYLMAFRKELGAEIVFPTPTHSHVLPRGYQSSSSVAKKRVNEAEGCFQTEPQMPDDLPSAVTASEALSDLPVISKAEKIGLKQKRVFDFKPYASNEGLSNYATLMRTWEGFPESEGIGDHWIRKLPRDYRIFQKMEHGAEYPRAHEIALELFEKERKRLKYPAKSLAAMDLYKDYVPPYPTHIFPNKWRKMEPDAPARTLMAHLGKDSYSHIHYDHDQARTISVREAARLQSFPDGFKFVGAMNASFRQIGNAVPPLMAFAIAGQIKELLRNSLEQLQHDELMKELPN